MRERVELCNSASLGGHSRGSILEWWKPVRLLCRTLEVVGLGKQLCLAVRPPNKCLCRGVLEAAICYLGIGGRAAVGEGSS